MGTMKICTFSKSVENLKLKCFQYYEFWTSYLIPIWECNESILAFENIVLQFLDFTEKWDFLLLLLLANGLLDNKNLKFPEIVKVCSEQPIYIIRRVYIQNNVSGVLTRFPKRYKQFQSLMSFQKQVLFLCSNFPKPIWINISIHFFCWASNMKIFFIYTDLR